jgi:peptidoglycan/xylan/chitin deacetylase (PgdA/CDA1 family)
MHGLAPANAFKPRIGREDVYWRATCLRSPAPQGNGTRGRPDKAKRAEVAQRFSRIRRTPPHARWPNNARIAININLNFETGGERSMLEGDGTSENMLTDTGFPAYAGMRSQIVETAFEFGPRVGNWRILRILKQFGVKVSVLGVVRALVQSPDAVAAFLADGHEIVSHGYRWIDY